MCSRSFPLGKIGFSVLFGWIIKRLLSPEIRRE
jgi:hypothetical protein